MRVALMKGGRARRFGANVKIKRERVVFPKVGNASILAYAAITSSRWALTLGHNNHTFGMAIYLMEIYHKLYF